MLPVCLLAGRWSQSLVDVAGNEEVETAVAVVIAPCGGAGPVAELNAGLLGNVRECAIVIVAIEAVLADVGDVNVGPAVVVEVGDGDACAPAFVCNACLRGDVRECAVVVVAKERGVGRGRFARKGIHCRPVDDIDGEPAGVVEVDEPDARAFGLYDVALVGGSHLVGPAGEARLLADVFKDNGAGFDEVVCGGGAVLGVDEGGVGGVGLLA